MLLCLCRGVTDREVRRCARLGACSTDDVARRTGAGTGCGTCRPQIREIVENERREEPLAAK